VAVSGNNPQPAIKGTIGVDRPQVSSGSDTYPLDVAAALKSDKKTLTVSVVNPTSNNQQAVLNFAGPSKYKLVKILDLSGKSIDDYNVPGKPPTVSIKDLPLPKKDNGNISVAPFSITLLEFSLD
jgi:alpha-N-arabinofuranosidase